MALSSLPRTWLATCLLLVASILVFNFRYLISSTDSINRRGIIHLENLPRNQPRDPSGTEESHRWRHNQVETPNLQELEKNLTSQYFTNEEMEEFLLAFNSSATCGKISRLFSIGKSVHGVDLWVLEISDRPGILEQEPNFKYVANMHGNEPGGRQLLMKLAMWLCNSYNQEPRATRIVNEMHMFLMPTMNPDGFKSWTRENGNKVDLNRNFPDRNHQRMQPMVLTGREEPETIAVIKWSEATPFVASGIFHEGALVANYPWDASDDGEPGYAASADDNAFIYLAKTYASHHQNMAQSQEFPEGITNGNHWYPVYGGMQDWSYINVHCFELTLEVSQHKAISPGKLMTHWTENKEALVVYPIAAALGILSGVVMEAGPSLKPLQAKIVVEGIDFDISTGATFGDYYRVLAPGSYKVTAEADGYEANTANVIVPTEYDRGIVQDFYLKKL